MEELSVFSTSCFSGQIFSMHLPSFQKHLISSKIYYLWWTNSDDINSQFYLSEIIGVICCMWKNSSDITDAG